ncbi:MAG: ankyrin repeat domain-containing protein [bacterium]
MIAKHKIFELILSCVLLAGTGTLPVEEALAQEGRMVLEPKGDVFQGIVPEQQELIKAVKDRNIEKVKEMLEKRPEYIEARYRFGITPLHWAARTGNLEIARLLIERGIEVNARNKNGVTSLHEAAIKGDIPMARLLLKSGARINARDENGKPTIQFALAGGHAEMVKFLQSRGASW